MTEHKIMLIFGPDAGKHNTDSAELLSFLQKGANILKKEFKYEYQLLQKEFASQEEQAAFMDGLNLYGVDTEDIAVVKDNLYSKEFLTLFGQSPIKGTRNYRNEIEAIKRHLKEITESTWIPFASPAPSSTECILKKHVFNAIESLENALIFIKRLA